MSDRIRVIVCGGRDWADSEHVGIVLARELILLGWSATRLGIPATLVHGAAKGADSLADDWARSFPNTLEVEPHPANWKQYGKAAGPARNAAMASNGADLCVAFWDGASPGTADMIRRAVSHGIPVKIFPPRKRLKSPDAEERK